MVNRLCKILFLVYTLTLFTACPSPGPGPVKKGKIRYPNTVTSQMQSQFDQAENLFRAKNYPQAKAEFQAYAQAFPYNRLTDLSEYRLGQILMLDKKYSEATSTFTRLIQKTPDPGVASRSRVKAGICQYRLKNTGQALGYFNKVEGQYLKRNDKIKTGGLGLLSLRGQAVSIEKRAYFDALLLDGYQGLNDTAIQQRYSKEAPSRQEVINQLKVWANASTTPARIDPRFMAYRGPESTPYILFKLGSAYYSAGNSKKAKNYLGDLVDRYPSSPLASQANTLLASLGKRSKKTGQVYKVGVILPLSGKYESYGMATLNGMECAAGNKVACKGVNNIQLVTRDDGGKPETAAKAVEDLVQQDKVMVILGPLSSGSAIAAAQKAQQLGVPMISLAQKEGIPKVGSQIYRFSLTPDQQVQTLLQATAKQDKKMLAVLYPEKNYGKVFLQKLKASAPNYGVEVIAERAYKDPRNAGEDIRQLKFSTSKATRDNPLGFEAIFIPDSYVAILSLLPQLESMGLNNVSFLGTNAWKDPRLASSSSGLLDGAIFLDIFFKGAGSGSIQNFKKQYQAAFGQEPSTLEAMGYDVVQFVSVALGKNKISSPADVKLALDRTKNFSGITGLKGFRLDRESEVQPYLLTIQNGQIVELKP